MNGGPDYVRPATTYLALMLVSPTPAGGGTEVTASGYARLAFTNDGTNWPSAAGGSKVNGVAMSWGTAVADFGTIVAVAEYDASVGGNLLKYGLLTTAITILAGQPATVAAGAATLYET